MILGASNVGRMQEMESRISANPGIGCDGLIGGSDSTCVPLEGDVTVSPEIEVSINEDGGEVAIAVADDGIGLPEQDRLRLTEPYVTHKPKGTGLGLAIVKKIMEDHTGRMSLDDRVARADWGGSGAVATLFLPLPAPDRVADGS